MHRLPRPVAQRMTRLKSGGKGRFNMLRQRAAYQHADYVRQLDGPRPYRSFDVEPKLWSQREEVRMAFGEPTITEQPSETTLLRSLEKEKLEMSFQGHLREVALEPFGVIEVRHGDIFDFKGWDEDFGRGAARATVLPMAANLLPYRGLGLEAFDRGGPALVKASYEAAKLKYEVKKKEDENDVTIKLEAGDALSLPLHMLPTAIGQIEEELEKELGTATDKERIKELEAQLAFKRLIFMIMPWIWEGSPMDAEKQLRFCVRRAFHMASLHCHSVLSHGQCKGGTVALPNLGAGIYGYAPKDSSELFVEEAIESLLQLEASEPTYGLRRICFVDAKLDTAEALASALVEVSRRWLPEERIVTAPEWWGRQTRRLVVLPDVPNFFWRRFRVKFKKRHGIKKRFRVNYIGNMKPKLWRAQKVQQPPPLLVKPDGSLAEDQLKARPYFYRGVSHWLFPSRRGGFPSMKRNGQGQWVGANVPYIRRQLTADVRPKA